MKEVRREKNGGREMKGIRGIGGCGKFKRRGGVGDGRKT